MLESGLLIEGVASPQEQTWSEKYARKNDALCSSRRDLHRLILLLDYHSLHFNSIYVFLYASCK
jgi:hypothetical protein